MFTGGAAATEAVCALSAFTLPAVFEAVTRTTRVSPTSAAVAMYVLLSAPEIAVQVLTQRRHWYAKVIGAVPVQVPVEAVSV